MVRRLARMSPQAAAWLKAEIAYLADRNPAAARKVAERLRLARQTLAEYPGLASAGLIPGTRRLVVAPYALTIRVREGPVDIIAIRHARQADAHEPRHGGDDVPVDGKVH